MTYETDQGPAPAAPLQTVQTCSFCREPLNEGATACKFCGRSQPLPPEELQARYLKIAAAVVAGVIVLWIGLGTYQDMAEERMAQRIADCSSMHGHEQSADVVRYELKNERQPGVSFDQAAKFMLFAAGCGQ